MSRQPIGSSLRHWLGRPLRSLSSRMILSVFSAALISSVLVTWTSTRSTERFLRGQIEEQFPELLHTTRQRLELWYAQRELDIATFAGSETVTRGLDTRATATAAAERYLGYVLEAFPQYDALFLMREDGALALWSGAELELPKTLLARLGRVEAPQTLAGQPYQIVSSPVDGGAGPGGSLHGLLAPRALAQLGGELDLGVSRRLFILDAGGAVILRAGSGVPTGVAPPEGQEAALVDHVTDDGRRVVGSALPFERFDWTIVIEDDYDVAFAPVVTALRRVLRLNVGIVALFGLVAFQIARSVTRPILALTRGARRIADGESDVQLPRASRLDEIRVLTLALDEMMSQVSRKQAEVTEVNDQLLDQNTELQHVNEMLEQLSITDGLTRLHNHRHFQERLQVETRAAQRSGTPLSLLLIDVDHFKSINDRFGHDAGDQALRRMAMTIHNVSRETDLPVRYGGEEFAVLAPQTDLIGAQDLAERIRMAISETSFCFREGGVSHEETVTVSIGCAELRADVRRLFGDADEALYAAKGAGRDCVVTAEPELERPQVEAPRDEDGE